MPNRTGYNERNAESILEHARRLDGRSLEELYPDACAGSENAGRGNLGQLVEQLHFGIKANNDSRPDFVHACLELKTTGLLPTTRQSKYIAKERLTLSMIDFNEIPNETFYTSAFVKKNASLLIMVYQYEKSVHVCQRRFVTSFVYQIPPEDKEVFEEDWAWIQSKIRNGEAHLLSESQTSYIAAATKGADSSDTVGQPFSDVPAMRRAFCIKRPYLDYIIRRHLGQTVVSPTSLRKRATAQETELSLDEMVVERVKRYVGMKKTELFRVFNRPVSSAKNWASILVKLMLGMSADDEVAEFVKSGLSVKTVTTIGGKVLPESMSFSQIKYRSVLTEDWEESYLHGVLTSRFLVLVFNRDTRSSEPVFRGVFFWSLPSAAVDEGYEFWQCIKSAISRADFETIYALRSTSYYHIRPKARNSYDMQQIEIAGRVFYAKKMAYWINSAIVKKELSRHGYLLASESVG